MKRVNKKVEERDEDGEPILEKEARLEEICNAVPDNTNLRHECELGEAFQCPSNNALVLSI